MLCCDPCLKDIKWAWSPTGESPAQACGLCLLTLFNLCLPSALFPPSLLVSSKRHLEFHAICSLWPIPMEPAIQKHLIWLTHPTVRWMSDGCHEMTWLQPFHWCDKWIVHMKVRATNIFAYRKVLTPLYSLYLLQPPLFFKRKLKTNFKTCF